MEVGTGWLPANAHPESKAELLAWGADVVASLISDRDHPRVQQANVIEAQAASACELKAAKDFPIHPICKGRLHTPADCLQFGRFVRWAEKELLAGSKVIVHCRQGQHRTGVAIYILIRQVKTAADDEI